MCTAAAHPFAGDQHATHFVLEIVGSQWTRCWPSGARRSDSLFPVPMSEADTHSKLVSTAIYSRGWTEDYIKREETTGAVDHFAGILKQGMSEFALRFDANGRQRRPPSDPIPA